jgi:hypothetical protein
VARPRRPRRVLAAALRRVASWAGAWAGRLAPAGAAPSGPPEHWAALVAARAPALLRGEGIGTRRVPAWKPSSATVPRSEPAPRREPVRRREPALSRESPVRSVRPIPGVPEPVVPQRVRVRMRDEPGPARPVPPAAPEPVRRAAPRLRILPAPVSPAPVPAQSTVDSAPRPVPALRLAAPPDRPGPRSVPSADPGAPPTAGLWPQLPEPSRNHGAPTVPAPPATPAVRRPADRPAEPEPPAPTQAVAARTEPDPWPALPDDSPLWTVRSAVHDTDRLRRLDEEQVGR